MWQGIEGHDELVERFRASIARGRLASTFLFVGPPGVGKRRFATALAQSLLCVQPDRQPLDPCGQCRSCTMLLAGNHPDLIVVAKPADRAEIPLALLLGEKEQRMREGLCHDISLKPYMGGRKVAIIDDADTLNEEGANALLKTLEEPPPRSVLILIGTSADKQLPTIRSRAQLVRFNPLPEDTVARLLMQDHGVGDPATAAQLASLSGGSLERALALANEAIAEMRSQLLAELAQSSFDAALLSKSVLDFVEAAGKDAASKRARMRQLVEFACDFYRQLIRAQAGLATTGDAELLATVDRLLTRDGGNAERWLTRADACVETLEYIDRNAHQATLIEAWLDRLCA